jgi:SAM-dependent methyltransferase
MINDPETIRYLRQVRETHVDPLVSHPLYDEFLKYLAHYEHDIHYPRFAQTMAGLVNALGDSIIENKDIKICETGDLSVVANFFVEQGYKVRGTSTDLRYTIDAPDDAFDLVFSLEVLEHIKDQTEKDFADLVLFKGTGVECYAAEIHRVLKKGGMLVLTTPNPNSVKVLIRLIDYEAPMIYRGHVQEYTKTEIVQIFSKFQLVEYKTFFAYFLLDTGLQVAAELAKKIGWNAADRGDCHFFLLRKANV